MPKSDIDADKRAIRELVENWAVWRDAGVGPFPHGVARRRSHDGDLVSGELRGIHQGQ